MFNSIGTFGHFLTASYFWTTMAIYMLSSLVGAFTGVLVHEMGHAVGGAVTRMPINGIGFGILSGGYGWYWPPNEPWGIFKGKAARRRGGMNPHVSSYRYPSVGWSRMIKSFGGPTASLISVIFVLALYAPHLDVRPFWLGVLFIGVVGSLNIIPSRGITRLWCVVYRLARIRVPAIDRWLADRAKSRQLTDGDRFWSTFPRWRDGRQWRRCM